MYCTALNRLRTTAQVWFPFRKGECPYYCLSGNAAGTVAGSCRGGQSELHYYHAGDKNRIN